MHINTIWLIFKRYVHNISDECCLQSPVLNNCAGYTTFGQSAICYALPFIFWSFPLPTVITESLWFHILVILRLGFVAYSVCQRMFEFFSWIYIVYVRS